MKVCINTTNVMSRVIYTPQIGFACTQFSRAYETHLWRVIHTHPSHQSCLVGGSLKLLQNVN